MSTENTTPTAPETVAAIDQIAGTEMPPLPPSLAASPSGGILPDPSALDKARIEGVQDLGKDSLDREFDPEKFRPEKDSIGRWKNLKGGRKGGKVKASTAQRLDAAHQNKIDSILGTLPEKPAAEGAEAPGQVSQGNPPPARPLDAEAHEMRVKALAGIYTNAGIAGAMAIFGPEWKPDDQDEFEMIRAGVADYVRASDSGPEMTPGAALGLLVLTYAAKRIPRPQTQARLAYWKEKISGWFNKGRAMIAGRRVAAAVAGFNS